MALENNRQLWNQRQKVLRNALTEKKEQQNAIPLFLDQHAMLHAAEISGTALWSFADEVWQDMTEALF